MFWLQSDNYFDNLYRLKDIFFQFSFNWDGLIVCLNEIDDSEAYEIYTFNSLLIEMFWLLTNFTP